jgi:crotonobetainyl-CoA:carnitine CoA-transferase CaiB-like acyl-CoA transferase
VYAQITGYGQRDPRVGYDAVVQAESGFQHMNGSPEGEPCKMPVALVDVITAHQLKEAVLVQLWRRERTGRGGAVEVSLMHSAVSALANQASGYLLQGAVPRRLGSDHPTIAPYGTIFATRAEEEPITLAVGSDSQFRALCAVLGRPELAQSGSPYQRNQDRCARREPLKAELRAEMSKWPRAELLDRLAKAAVPCGAVNDLRGTFATPQAQELVVLEHSPSGAPGGKAFVKDGRRAIGLRQIAFKGSPEGLPEGDAAPKPLKPPPGYAQHTDSVLRELLGLTSEHVQRLRDDNVVQ